MVRIRRGLVYFVSFCLVWGIFNISFTREIFAQAEGEQEEVLPSGNITLDFKEADIQNVLKIISYKAGINIVTTPEVMGTITIRLVDVPWEKALDVILKTHGYGYDRVGNIITVAPIDKLTEQKQKEVQLAQVQPTITEVFHLDYLDAQDAKNALEPQLSPRGRITVLAMTGQAGWEFGTCSLTAKRKRVEEERIGRSKILIVSDIPPVLDKIREVIEQIDKKPRQILIETRLVEVNNDFLRDIGLDWGTGADGVTTRVDQAVNKKDGEAESTIGIQGLSTSNITSSIFNPAGTGISPGSAGLDFVFSKLTGTQFEVILTAIEEDVDTNTLSAPSIVALNNQEATILVGEKYPILKTEESTQSQYTVSQSLDYYQDIGVQLNVVPQISANDYINMIVHPAVTSTTSGVGSTNTTFYPIIDTREAETRILLRSGETIVIGGLLKDVVSEGVIGIPLLMDIPFLGKLFRRDTKDTQKIDLIIFITARILEEGESVAEHIVATADLPKEEAILPPEVEVEEAQEE